MTVSERSMNVPGLLWTFHERFWLCVTFLWPENSETFRNVGRSGTVNGQGRWTVGNIHTVQDKRSKTFPKSCTRYFHGTFTVRSRSRFNNERNTVKNSDSSCRVPWTWICKRFKPFILYSISVSDHPMFLTIPERPMFPNVTWPFLSFSGHAHGTFMERSWNVHANDQERWTVVTLNDPERLGTFEP